MAKRVAQTDPTSTQQAADDERAESTAAIKALKKVHGELQAIPFAQLQKLQEHVGIKRFRGLPMRV